MIRYLWAPGARAQLRAFPQPEAFRVLRALAHFARTGEGDVSSLHGPLAGTLRLRVADWRVRFRRLEPGLFGTLAVGHRSEIYQ